MRERKKNQKKFKFNVALRPQKTILKDYQGRGTLDDHLDIHTVPELSKH